MTYQNNYHFSGPTAILYKVVLDNIGLQIDYYNESYGQYVLKWDNESGITDIGFEWKKSDASVWNEVSCVDTSSLNSNGTLNTNCFSLKQYTGNTLFSNYFMAGQDTLIQYQKRVMPIYAVLRGLGSQTDYTIRSYIARKDTQKTYYNAVTATTTSPSPIPIHCNGIEGGTDNERNKLSGSIDTAVEILNSITNIGPQYSLQEGDNNSFTAKITQLNGACAVSSMEFQSNAPSCLDLQTVMHEMMHNQMYIHFIDERNRDSIIKYMEFATHSSGAIWRWQGAHCYPVILPNDGDIVSQYLIAACSQANKMG